MFQSRKKANEYRDLCLLSVLPAVLFLLLGIFTASAIVIFIGLLLFIIPASLYGNYETWSLGAEGEEKVAENLNLLDDRYRVIHDVMLPKMYGNIDHIVLGPNGVFVIETKNHKGFIVCDGDSWNQHKVGRRGTPYLGNIGSPSRQVKRMAIFLRDFIRDHCEMNLYVNGIVVFTNENAKLRINNPTVAVLRPQEISDFIQSFDSKTFAHPKLEELEAALRLYSCYS